MENTKRRLKPYPKQFFRKRIEVEKANPILLIALKDLKIKKDISTSTAMKKLVQGDTVIIAHAHAIADVQDHVHHVDIHHHHQNVILTKAILPNRVKVIIKLKLINTIMVLVKNFIKNINDIT